MTRFENERRPPGQEEAPRGESVESEPDPETIGSEGSHLNVGSREKKSADAAALSARGETVTRLELARRFHRAGYVLIPLRGLHENCRVNGELVTACGKEAFTEGWPETRETDLGAVGHNILQGGNYGILPGASGRAVLDVERAGLDTWPLDRLPDDAFVVRTPSGGLHVYLDAAAVEQVLGRELRKERFDNKAELFGRTGQVVGPGCRAYSNKAKREGVYEIVRDGRPIDDPAVLARILEPFQRAASPRRAMPPARTSVPTATTDAWAWKALTAELGNVAAAPEGARHDAMMHSSFKLGQLVGAGLLDRESVQEQLVVAATANGLPEGEARRCATDGVEAGQKAPRTPQNVDREINSRDHDGSYTDDRTAPESSVQIADDRWPMLAIDALHGLAGDFVSMVSPHSESSAVALLGQFLVGFGNCIGRSAHFLAEADRHYSNIYMVAVGRTSKGRKGTSHGHVRNLFKQVDEGWITACENHGLSSGEGLIWAVRDPIEKEEPVKERGKVVGYQTVVADTGIEDKRLLVFESEFAQCLRVLDREGNTLSAVVRNAWDTGDLSTMTKNSPARATGAHISIVGHITQDEALRYLDRTEAANGFGNRFLWLCVRRSKVLPEGGRVPNAEIQAFAHRLRRAVEFGRGTSEVMRDQGARELWIKVYRELSEGRPGLLGAITARAEAQVMRLALLYSLLDVSSTIRREHLLAGLALWAYAEDSAAYVFGSSLGDPVADEILRTLRAAKDGLSRTQIRDLFGRNRGKDEIGRALGVLLSQGLARFEEREHEGPGRRAEVWFATTTRREGIRSWRSFLSYREVGQRHTPEGEAEPSDSTTKTTESHPRGGHAPVADAVGGAGHVPPPTTETTNTTEAAESGGSARPIATTETTSTTESVRGREGSPSAGTDPTKTTESSVSTPVANGPCATPSDSASPEEFEWSA